MANFYSIITNRGKELEAEALASGTKITLVKFVVGDGNGQATPPKPTQTKLVNEKYRGDIGELSVSPDQSTQMMAKIVLPTDVGGFTVREIGILTDAGDLYAVANCAAIEKPVGGVSVNMQFRLAVSDTANITLNVATGDGLFLRIDQDLSEIRGRGALAQKAARESLAIVDASTKQKGLVQLNSATNSTSEIQAATPAAVKVANDNANGRVPSERKVNGHALSDDINISSEDVGALPVNGGYLSGDLILSGYGGSGASRKLERQIGGGGGWSVVEGTYKKDGDTKSHIEFYLYNKTSKARLNIFGAMQDYYGAKDGVTKETGAIFNVYGTIIPADYSNFDDRYQNAGYSYSKSESDGKYQPKGNYTPAGEAYTKIESNARYLMDVRLGATITSAYTSSMNRAASGCVITGIDVDGTSDATKIEYKAIQKNINGQWYTISQN